MKRNMKYLVVALVIVAIVLLPARVRAEDTCMVTYEKAALAANIAAEQCLLAVYDIPWYRPDLRLNQGSLCTLEFTMEATEASAKFVKCMSIDVIFNFND